MLYQTTVTNQDGIKGWVQVSDNDPLQTSHPLKEESGYNPEQLIGAAWSTCFNATLQAILAENGRAASPSRVTVQVSLEKETQQPGYYFQVQAQVAIAGLSAQDARPYVEQAHHRCPVSKLFQGATTVDLEVVAG